MFKYSVKIPKNEEIKKLKFFEQFFRVRYSVSMNFIDVLKKKCML